MTLWRHNLRRKWSSGSRPAEPGIPRNALVWILLSQLALLLPHLPQLPVWVIPVYLCSALWRGMVLRGQWPWPSRSLRLGLIVAGFTAVWLSFGGLLGLEPTVALLLTAFALKLLELQRRRDACVLIFLGYFIAVTVFLFNQDLLLVFYMLGCVWLLTTALVALHRPGEDRFTWATGRLPAAMLLQAVPVMLVLFFVFPRIGPLWSVPMKTQAAKTGVSDHMKPGDVSSLSRSDEVAFRVQFDGEIPPHGELYWRGLVFSILEEGAWRSLRYQELPPREWRRELSPGSGRSLDYQILMEPTQQHWLYALRYPQPLEPGVMAMADYRLYSPVEVEERFRYRVRSWPDVPLDPEVSDWRRQVEQQLPEEGNPRTRALARDLRAAATSDVAFVDSVLDYFRDGPFVYTLQPGLLGEDPIDEFLFQRQRGFCEHYASAFTIMMRAAGVPARVVAGYQGGEVNPVNRTVIVHQFDAHAWSEVWLAGQGWVRIDPTAVVSPERISLGLEEALAEKGSFLAESPLSPLRYRRINWVNMLRLRYDALTYQWQSWVVGFDSERQLNLLRGLFGEVRVRDLALLLLGSATLVLVPVAWWLLRGQRPRRSQEEQLYQRFSQLLARRGLVRRTGEAVDSFARRVAQEQPDAREPVQQFTDSYSALVYGPPVSPSHREACLRTLRYALRQL